MQFSALYRLEKYSTVVPRNVRLGEAPSFGQPILSYDRRSVGAAAYRALAREWLARQALAGAADGVHPLRAEVG